MNELYFGDCLDVLQELSAKHPDGFIDLIYIDPPFNSKRNYNVLFESIDMKDATAQKQAFADTWSNYDYIDTLKQIAELDKDLYDFLSTLSKIRTSDSSVAYLTTMAIRIYYMHKLLKDTGSFYLHCDSTMSHPLKMVCDLIFGEKNYKNEIIWKRAHTVKGNFGQGKKSFDSNADTILFYSKTDKNIFNPSFSEYDEKYLTNFYKYEDIDGRRYRLISMIGPGGAAKGNPYYEIMGVKRYWRYSKKRMDELIANGLVVQTNPGTVPQRKQYLDEGKGVSIQTIWDDIQALSASSKEKLGYPTQKPEDLLERIISASTNKGDVVADFFCGCGTTIAAAQKLNRNWIGADISHLAVRLIVKRLVDTYGQGIKHDIKIHGFPRDIGSARELAEGNGGRFDFQEWVVEVLLNGVLNAKKTADGGWDGYLTFDTEEKKEFVIIEVKSGNVNVKNVREFIQVVDKANAAIGIFVCFAEQVTKPMEKEIKEAGYYKEKIFHDRYPRLQILTIEDLLQNKQPDMPKYEKTTFKSAVKSKDEKKTTKGLFD